MSLQWQLARQMPTDTAGIGRAVLRSENVFRQIGDRFDELFPNEDEFAELYQPTGRGAISPLLLALVTVFQMLEKVPDRLAAEYVVSRIDWKYALHLPISYTGFHFCDLSAFRKRLLEHKRERLVFEQFLERLKVLGLIKSRGKVRTDSTSILAVVERLSQLELVTESIRVALRAVRYLDPDWVERELSVAFCEVYSVQRSEFGLSREAVQSRLAEAGRDGFWFLAEVDRSASPAVQALTEVGVLRRVLAEQFPDGPTGPAATKRPTGDVIESPHETEARRGAKRGKGWTGYKMQVTESCDKDQPHLIVDIEPTGALATDGPELPGVQARLKAEGLVPSEQYVDQGYVSGKRMAESAGRGINLVGKPLGDTSGPEGFRQGDFQIDESARCVTCPRGKVSVVWSERSTEEGEPSRVEVGFEAKTCRACPSFGQCTSSRQGRSLELHPYREVLEARRREAETEEYREKLHLRAGIEGAISELVRAHGLRTARYRGLVKLRLQGLFTVIAVNLKRLTRWWTRPERATMTSLVTTTMTSIAAYPC